MKRKDKIFKDKDENLYKFHYTSNPEKIKLYLKNIGSKKWKYIADIDKSSKRYIKTIFNTHTFVKMHSIGFPYYILKALYPKYIETIEVYLPDKVLRITVEKALQVGKFINYKKKGYELQLQVPIEEFEVIKI